MDNLQGRVQHQCRQADIKRPMGWHDHAGPTFCMSLGTWHNASIRQVLLFDSNGMSFSMRVLRTGTQGRRRWS
jgi:hypothetical protein